MVLEHQYSFCSASRAECCDPSRAIVPGRYGDGFERATLFNGRCSAKISKSNGSALSHNDFRKKLMAVSSGGGHWVQLLRVSPAFRNCDIIFVTVDRSYHSQVPGHRFYAIDDATRWSRLALIKLTVKLAWLIWKEKPDVMFSTGAAPGYVALRLGRLVGEYL
jgi:hypothetical protein